MCLGLWMAVHVHTKIYILGRFLVHVVGSRTTVMRASHDRHCTSLLSKQFQQLAGLFSHALASKGYRHFVGYVNYLGYLFNIRPLRLGNVNMMILRKLVRMRQQCNEYISPYLRILIAREWALRFSHPRAIKTRP